MWNQLLVAALGMWITASPDVMGYEGPERLNSHIVGPLIVSAATIAAAETTRFGSLGQCRSRVLACDRSRGVAVRALTHRRP